MAKKGSDDLFHLIKSLEPTEKRYFIKWAKRHQLHSRNDYLWLFHELDKQTELDWEKIEQKMKGDTFRSGLSRVKRRLYDQLLRSMRAYSEENLAWTRIMGLLIEAEYLRGKGLLEQFKKRLDIAKSLAIKYKHRILLLQIKSKEWITHFYGLHSAEREVLRKEQMDIVNKHRRDVIVSEKISQFNDLTAEYKKQRKPEIREKMDHYMKDLSSYDIRELAIPVYLQLITTRTLYAFYVLRDRNQAAQIQALCIEYFLANDHLIHEFPTYFCSSCYNDLYINFTVHNYEVLRNYQVLLEQQNMHGSMKSRLNLITAPFFILSYLQQGSFSDIESVLERKISSREIADSKGFWKNCLARQYIAEVFYHVSCGDFAGGASTLRNLMEYSQELDAYFKITGYLLSCLCYHRLKEKLLVDSMFRRLKYQISLKTEDRAFFELLGNITKAYIHDEPAEKMQELLRQLAIERHNETSGFFLVFDIELLLRTYAPAQNGIT